MQEPVKRDYSHLKPVLLKSKTKNTVFGNEKIALVWFQIKQM